MVAAVFYDKEVEVYSYENDVDEEGWARQEAEPTGNTFKANVWFDKLEELRQDYGISDEVDIAISTHEELLLGSIVGYKGRIYKVVKAMPFDSYYLLLGKEWSSQLKD
jgi:hypothetical protein